MGVLNVTPDSFSDGGQFLDSTAALAHARQMVADGADIVDVGGESSQPGSEPVSVKDEIARVIPVIDALAKGITVPISIDTTKPEVARLALAHGATIINDISGLRDPRMVAVAVAAKAPVIIMHMQGSPKTMQKEPQYTNVVEEIKEFFRTRIAAARAAGITDITIDPGIGFGKTLEHNLIILKNLGAFKDLGCSLLVGTSRKSFIGALTGGLPTTERLEGTLASIAIAVFNGADIVRVHDVKAARRAVQVSSAIAGALSDTIFLRGLVTSCYIGISQQERTAPQDVSVDVEVSMDTRSAAKSVQLAQTIDYSNLRHTVMEVCASRPWTLVEELAQEIADRVLADTRIQAVTVRVGKPQVAGQWKSKDVGVEITRSR
ncbi:dihydropteroate synthase, partial [Candidatus Uhrbacteria bacterium]|nr:dihydropteroate synthase [Candidatus Uhrbacteria bacterium]